MIITRNRVYIGILIVVVVLVGSIFFLDYSALNITQWTDVGNVIENPSFETGTLSTWTTDTDWPVAPVTGNAIYYKSGSWGCPISAYSGGTYYLSYIQQVLSPQICTEGVTFSLYVHDPTRADISSNIKVTFYYTDSTTDEFIPTRVKGWGFYTFTDFTVGKIFESIKIEKTGTYRQSFCSIDNIFLGVTGQEPTTCVAEETTTTTTEVTDTTVDGDAIIGGEISFVGVPIILFSVLVLSLKKKMSKKDDR